MSAGVDVAHEEDRRTPILRVVMCGSMTFYAEMRAINYTLSKNAVRCSLPKADDPAKLTLPPDQYETYKRGVSQAHIRRVRSPETYGILAVNLDKHGIRDYIGANTFAEIAVAFAQHKRLYLLQGIPRLYEDELRAWGAIALEGDLKPLVRDYRATAHSKGQQPSLFH